MKTNLFHFLIDISLFFDIPEFYLTAFYIVVYSKQKSTISPYITIFRHISPYIPIYVKKNKSKNQKNKMIFFPKKKIKTFFFQKIYIYIFF